MKNRRAAIVILSFLLLLIPGLLIAQENESDSSAGEEKTVEELFLQSVEMRIIGEQAFSDGRETKLAALENLAELIENGGIASGDPEAHFILDSLSSEGIGVSYREGRRVVNNFPEVRRRACELLGKIGGKASKDTLINVLLSDNEPMVLSEAVYALGSMGGESDDDRQLTQAISYSILNQDLLTPDQNFGYAALLAIEKLAEKNGGINDPSVYRALIRISQGNYLNTVQKKAQEVIKTLMSY